MATIDSLKASNGAGNAASPIIQSVRAPSATTLVVNTVQNINTTFHATMGTPHTFVDPVTGESITVISEATAVDFIGHVDGGNLEIDTIAPGFVDNGSQVGDIVIIKPTTQWANSAAEVLEVSHEDDGTIKSSAIPGGVLGETRYYESAGSPHTWTKPAGLKFVIVEVQGGGGGGGGSSSSNETVGAGGGGGGYVKGKLLAASLGATETVTVGAGGGGGGAGNSNGSAGGDSSFGTLLTAGGGGGGAHGTSSLTGGGTGGTATGGDLNIPGSNGGSKGNIGAPVPAVMRNGLGGSSFLGIGANRSSQGSSDGQGGATGGVYGGGGSGGVRLSSSTSGGSGAPGIVIVHEYY